SPVMDDKSGNYYVVRTDDIVPSAVKPFDDVKNNVLAGWKTQEQARLAAIEADKIVKGLRDGKSASSYAVQKGVDVRVSKPVSMLGENDPALPQSMQSQMLQMKKGEVVTAPMMDQQLILR